MNQTAEPVNKNSKRNKTIWIVVIVVLVLCCLVTAAIVGGFVIFRGKDSTDLGESGYRWGDAMLLAYRYDGPDQSLSAYIYDLEENEVWLPAGRYYAEVKLADGTLLSFNPLQIVDEKDGKGAVDLQRRLSDPLEVQEASQQIDTLVRFLVGVDNVRLTYFKIISNGYSEPLFATTADLSWDQEAVLMDSFSGLGDQSIVVAAAQGFVERAESAAANQPGKAGLSRASLGIVDSVLSFFGILDEEDDLAREQILAMYDAFNEPWEKEEAFEVLDQNQLNGAANFDEFIEKVRNGEIKDHVSIRRELMSFGPMEGIMMDLHPDSNRPGGEVIHRVGSEAIKRGAELNVEVIKTVLTSSFPGIEEGFDYADKVNEWAEYVNQIYTDPLGALKDELVGQAEDAIKDRIKSQFQALFPEMDESDVDDYVDQIVEQVSSTATTLVEIQEEIAAEETDQAVTQEDEEATEEEMVDFEETATEEPEITETQELTQEIEETETPEPTATNESLAEEEGLPSPDQDIALPDDLSDLQSDPNKDDNTNFVWDPALQCWNYVGPALENSSWDCVNQCFNFQDEDWFYECGTGCPSYIGPDSEYWGWDCETWGWVYLDPNYYYNNATQCLEYVGPDAHLWYWDCNRECLEYIGPEVSDFTWSCEQHRWVPDE